MGKQFIAIISLIVMLISTTIAYANEYSTMSDGQIKEQYELLRNELTRRGLKAEKKTVILEQDGIEIYVNGAPYIGTQWSPLQLVIPIIVINNTDKNIALRIDKSSINGWASKGNAYGNPIPTMKKAKVDILFTLSDTDIEADADFTDAEFTITVVDNDNYYSAEPIIPETNPITIYANK